jgi:tRNA ligase
MRGENHQTLRPDTAMEHERILWQFINAYDELSESEVDDIIEMNITEGVEGAIRRAIDGICSLLRIDVPSDEAVDEAINLAKSHRISEDHKKPMAAQSASSKASSPRYYGLVPTQRLGDKPSDSPLSLRDLMDDLLAANGLAPTDATALVSMWNKMKEENRIVTNPHLTIVHQKSLEADDQLSHLWSLCVDLSRTPAVYRLRLNQVVYNQRILALAMEPGSLSPLDKTVGNVSSQLAASMPISILRQLHITVATIDDGVKQIEAGDLVSRTRNGELKEDEGVVELKEGPLEVQAVLRGLFK